MIADRVTEALAALGTAPIDETARTALTRSRHRRHRAAGMMSNFVSKGAGMRTVKGRTDRVVVVGAGLGGLACALHLAGSGRQVTVLEREPVPGGRAGRLSVDGYEFDTGPTVLTMPDLIAEALGAVGEELTDWLDLSPLDPAYRAYYPDGSTLDVITDTTRMADEIARVCGPREADGYLRFVDYARNLWQWERADFIDRNLDAPTDLLTGNLLKLFANGAFRRLQTKVNQFFRDPRTQRIFSFQAMYAGLSPHDALAIYAVIAYLDSVAGVCFPRGGIHAVSRGMAGAAEKHGVQYPVRHHGDPGGDRQRPRHRRDHRRRRASSPPTRWCSTPTCRSPTSDLLPRQPAAQADLLAVLRGAARRFDAGLWQDRPPQHPLRAVLEGHVRRGDPPRRADDRPVAAGDEPEPHRPVAGAGREAHLLRAGAGAEPGAGAVRLDGRPRASGTPTSSSARSRSAATSASATASR